MRQINTEGIILGKKPYGEGHELVFIFSKDLGKIKAQAKGSRKIKSKFLGHLETLNICNLQIYQGPHSLIITECNTIQPFNFEKLSPIHTEYGLKIAYFLGRSLAEEEADAHLYLQIQNAISEFSSSNKPLLSYLQICTSLINHLGFFSDFSNTCPTCLNESEPDAPFYLLHNEIITCRKCPQPGSINITIPGKYRKFLNYLTDMPLENKNRLRVSDQETIYLEKLIEAFFKSPHH